MNEEPNAGVTVFIADIIIYIICVVSILMELLSSFLYARLSAAAVIGLYSPVLTYCFSGHFLAARPSQNIVSIYLSHFPISYDDIFISHVRAAGGSPPQCQLTVEDAFWNATITHTADMTKPSQSALSKKSVHTGNTITRQDISIGYFVLPGPRIRRVLLKWNVLSILSCPTYVGPSPCLAVIQQCVGNAGIADRRLCIHRQLGACPQSSRETSES